MAYVYQNILIGNRLDVKPTGRAITTSKGDIITDDGVHTVRLPVGTDGQAMVADSTQTNGLISMLVTLECPIV